MSRLPALVVLCLCLGLYSHNPLTIFAGLAGLLFVGPALLPQITGRG